MEKRGQMVEEVKKMSQYQGYLDGVLEVEEEYPEIQDLLARYETLSAARDDLIKRQDPAADQKERERKELQEFMQERSDRILNYNNQIADLQQESEKAAEKVLEIQENADRQVQAVAESTLQLGQVMMACENIYQRCMTKTHVARKEVKPDGSGQLEDETEAVVEKLGFIRDYITDLQAISKLAKPVSTPKAELGATGGGGAGGAGGAADPAATGGGTGGSRIMNTDSKVSYYKIAATEARQSVRGHGDSQREGKGAHSQSRHSMSTGSEDTGR